ncbi:hypothetical protein HK102_004859 [Quaeritorhiza haematococci]|nr:hypothetical protein HK102_004859 [Quaeritorhiza haematococci]
MAHKIMTHLLIAALAAQGTLAAPASASLSGFAPRNLARRAPQPDGESVGQNIQNAISNVFDGAAAADAAQEAVDKVADVGQDGFNAVKDFGENAIDEVGGFFRGLFGRSPRPDGERVGQDIQNAVGGAVDQVVDTGDNVVDAIGNVGEDGFNAVKDFGENAIDEVGGFFRGLFGRSPRPSGESVGQDIQNAVGGAVDQVVNTGDNVVDAIGNVGEDGFNAVKDFGENAIDEVGGFFRGLFGRSPRPDGESVGQDIQNAVSGAVDQVVNTGDNVVDAIGNVGEDSFNAVKDFGENAIDEVGGFFRGLFGRSDA